MKSILSDIRVENLVRLVEESSRSSQEGVKRFIEPAQGTLSRAKSKRHHIIFGRRGSGKSSLLQKAAADLTVDRRPIAYVDLETFKGHSYPDVLISILISTLKEFEKWLRTAAINPASKISFWDKLFGTKPARPPYNRVAVGRLADDIHAQIDELNTQLYPWIVPSVSPDQEAVFTARRQDFEKVGFDGIAVRNALEDILLHDRHLRDCCVGSPQLAHCFDLNFISPALPLVGASAPREKLEELFGRFVSTVYGQGPFKVISLSHIFNFQSENARLRFGDVRIERLDSPTISTILGETSFGSFIYPQGTGDYFVVSEREGPCDDYISWLFDQKNKAELFTHVLQYFKDGVVHINYAAPYFLPQWVNPIRKWGIFFIGNPQRLPYAGGQRPYSVRADEIGAITRWWTTYQDPKSFQRISDLRPTLRQAGLRAGEYYELSHAQEKPEARLISLAIALEALFSPDDKGEFTFRISQSLAQLVGQTEADRLAIFRDTKKFYARRSELVHGQYDVNDYIQGRFVTHEECDRWASPIRRAILRFLTLYLRGRNARDELLNEISIAAINPEMAERLRRDSDPEQFLKTDRKDIGP